MSPHDRLVSSVQRIVTESGIPSIGIALSMAGQRHYTSVGTSSTAERIARHGRFKLGCTIKILLAIVVLEMANRKVLDLEAPIARYLPELSQTPKGTEIAVRHLLSHTGGYREFDYQFHKEAGDTFDWSRFVAQLLVTPQMFKPGTVFNYQHSEAVLLRAILERTTQRSFDDLLDEIIFAPLGISPGPGVSEDTAGFDVGGHAYSESQRRFVAIEPVEPEAGWSFWQSAVSHKTLSLPDMICIGEALILAHDAGAGRSPFSRYTASLLATSVVDIPALAGGKLSRSFPIGYSYGAPLFRLGMVGHDTSLEGQTFGLRFDLKRRVAFAVGLDANRPLLRLLGMDCVMRHVYGPEPAPAAPSLSDLSTLAGRYDGGSAGEAAIGLEGNELRLTLKNSNGTQFSTVMAIDENWRLHPTRVAGSPSIAFFREPTSHRLCMMVGTRALVKA